MLRISQYMKELVDPKPLSAMRKPSAPVVIWNLLRRCNLTCKHCYSISADKDFPGELSTQEIFDVMEDLRAFGVPALILSGGEPLLRPDIFEISARAKELGFYLGLSSNGTLIDQDTIGDIARVGYDYVGISIDGMRETHDEFRRKQGSYDQALRGIRLCRDAGVKVGVRFTLTMDNVSELPALLQLVKHERIDKFYLSHLNYAGRGNKNRGTDVYHTITREVMTQIFDTCWQDMVQDQGREYISGNNDADGVFFLQWVAEHHADKYAYMEQRLRQWGGNASGVNIANIDNLGHVHPDTFWWDYNLGNVRETPFSDIWRDSDDPLMQGLRMQPRPLKGRCAICQHQAICGGNTRVRAWKLTGDPWQEDPACYLEDSEIGIAESGGRRVQLTPWSKDERGQVLA